MEKSFRESASSVIVLMLVIKIIGFVKQAVVASCYGTSIELDIYFIAYGFITACTAILLRSLSVATVGVYGNLLETNPNRTDKLISTLINYFIIVSIVASAGIVCFSDQIANVLAHTYQGSYHIALVHDLRALAPLIMFSVFELLFGSVLNARKHFLIPRTESLIYSVIVIIACLIAAPVIGIKALIVARFCASFIYTVILFFSTRGKFRYSKKAWKPDSDIVWVFKKATPLILGNGITQINLIIDKTIATGLRVGVVSALSYGQTLSQLVVSVFIVEVSSVLFASFTTLVAKKRFEDVNKVLSNTIKSIVMITIPIAIVSVIMSESIVKIAFFRGSFTMDSVELTSAALLVYAIAFPFIAIKDLFVQSSYAFLDTKRPMVNGVITVAINTALSLILAPLIGIWGIAIGTTVADIISAFLAYFSFKKVNKLYQIKYILSDIIRYFMIGIPSTLACFLIKRLVACSDVVLFCTCTIICFAIYFGILIFVFKDKLIVSIVKKVLHIN